MTKDGGRAECHHEFLEGFVGAGVPGQGLGLTSEHGSQGGRMQTEILDETSIEISKSQESLKLLYRLGNWPLRDGSHLPLVHLNSLLANDVAEELHCGPMELALLQTEVQMVLAEPLKDLLNVVAMVSQVPGVDENIIDVDNHEVVEELPEHLVHEFLEDGWGVRNNEIFIVAGRGNEGRLPFIAFPDSNEVICAPQVQLGEDACPTEFLESGRDQGNWIGKLDCLGVQSSVINTRPQAPVLLTHEEETRGRR